MRFPPLKVYFAHRDCGVYELWIDDGCAELDERIIDERWLDEVWFRCSIVHGMN